MQQGAVGPRAGGRGRGTLKWSDRLTHSRPIPERKNVGRRSPHFFCGEMKSLMNHAASVYIVADGKSAMKVIGIDDQG